LLAIQCSSYLSVAVHWHWRPRQAYVHDIDFSLVEFVAVTTYIHPVATTIVTALVVAGI